MKNFQIKSMIYSKAFFTLFLPGLLFTFLFLCFPAIVNGQHWKPDNWMGDLRSFIDNKQLTDIIIPGTHDSGSFSPLLTTPVRTQDQSFKAQLEGGIRYFDLRISYVTENANLRKETGLFAANTFYLHHGGSSAPNQQLVPQLNDIKLFLQRHPEEIVILHVRTGSSQLCQNLEFQCSNGEDKMTDAQKKLLAKLLDDTFGGMIISPCSDLKVGSLKRSNKRVYIEWPGKYWSNSTFIYADKEFLYKKESDLLKNFTNPTMLFSTVEEKIGQMKAKLPAKLKSATSDALTITHLVAWSLNVFGTTKDLLLPKVLEMISAWHHMPDTRKGMNVIAVDFYNHHPYFIKLLMALNIGQNPYLTYEQIGETGWGGAAAMTAYGDDVFTVHGGQLWKTTPTVSSKSISTGWEFTAAMCSMDGYLYSVQGFPDAHMWQSGRNQAGSNDMGGGWTGTEALTSLNGHLYAVQGGKLWKKRVGEESQDLGSGWGGTECLTTAGNHIYAIHKGTLYKVDANGKSTSLGSGWNGTPSMAALGNYLYLLHGGKLWRHNLSNNVSLEMRNDQGTVGDWLLAEKIVATNDRLYVIQGNKLWRVRTYQNPLTTSSASRPKCIASNTSSNGSGITASVLLNEEYVYHFQGNKVSKVHWVSGKASGPATAISSRFPGVPSDIDATLNHPRNKDIIYFFSGSQYYRYRISQGKVDSGYPKFIASTFKGAPNKIDAALVNPKDDKYIYFFSGSNYYRVNWDNKFAVDAGYPKPAVNQFKGIPLRIDAAVNHPSNPDLIYFFAAGKYYRMKWSTFKVDAGYPKSVDFHWKFYN